MATESILTSMICSGCACLCDDIDLVLVDGRVKHVNNVCRWGSARFSGRKKFSDRQPRAPLLKARFRSQQGDRREINLPAAVTEAARLIAEARRIVIYGLCQMSQQSFDPLLALAAERNTLFIPSEGALWTEYLKILDDRSLPLTTLEAVRNQADLILFWGANPSHSCPRLLSRYALFARGRFTERGVEDRTAFSVDIQETEMARLSRMVVVSPGQELALLETLIKALAGAEPVSAPPISKKLFRQLVEALRMSRYPVIFCGRGPCYSPDRHRIMDALAQLATAVNREQPAFLLPLASDFNTVGFYQAFAQAQGFSRANWTLLDEIQEWGPSAGDLLLAVSGDGLWFMSERQKQQLQEQEVAVVSLSGFETMTTAAARVAIGVGILGVDGAGHATRLDGVVLPLEAVLAGERPTDATVLRAIQEAVAT
jgi:formylmethanofuran dehydrogenase subunit B